MANYERVLRLIPAAVSATVSASIPAIVAMPARIAAIVEIAGALSPAAVAARSPLGLSAEVPHEYEAGGEDKKDPGTGARETAMGELVGKSGRWQRRRQLYGAASPFGRPGSLLSYPRVRDAPRQGIRPWIPSSIPSIIR
jgi:hypothetical protein